MGLEVRALMAARDKLGPNTSRAQAGSAFDDFRHREFLVRQPAPSTSMDCARYSRGSRRLMCVLSRRLAAETSDFR